MKKDAAGVAGAARIDQLSMAELTHAELHGKRLDKTSKSRAINNDPPLTTTGLDLKKLYHSHVAGAFIPKCRAKAMQVVIQFPKDLVNGDDAALMLQHSRAFIESVFGPDAIFADRVDRDERSRHVVDLFIAPIYTKKTKHQEKMAVTMSLHQKELAQKYNCPPTPVGTGRALQDALFEYLRDQMRLPGVKRGEPKLIPGPDWKLPEQLRMEELADQKTRADARDADLDVRNRQIDGLEGDIAAREARINKRELEAEQAAAAASADRAAQAIARSRLERDLQRVDEDRRAAAAARAEAERRQLDCDAALEAVRVAERRAATAAADADQRHRDAEAVYATAIAERKATTDARQAFDERRKLHTAQLALLARAADDDNGLALRLGSDTFILREQRMTEQERAVNAKPWSSSMVAVARALATALDRIRDLARHLGLREKAIADREAADKVREAELARERMAQDARRVEHEAAVMLLNRQRAALEVDEARTATAAALAAKQLEVASVRQAEAVAAAAENLGWMRVMDALEDDPEAIEVAESGALRLDRDFAAAWPDIASAFQKQPPAWVASLAAQRRGLADALQRAAEQEGDAERAARRLANMINQAGAVLTPVQREAIEQATSILRRFDSRQTDLGR